jgi:riboflavin synthase
LSLGWFLMFTGIIREIGTVAAISRAGAIRRLTVLAPSTARLVAPLESVAVNGVCLTVVQAGRGLLGFEMIPETLARTALKRLREGARVNLEPSLSLADRLNGHVVLGHVDGVGAVLDRRQHAGELILRIRLAPTLRRFLVEKGPITVDGVSLTVGSRPTATAFTVHLIPETLRRTTLAARQAGDWVNLEVDYLAKLLAAGFAGVGQRLAGRRGNRRRPLHRSARTVGRRL